MLIVNHEVEISVYENDSNDGTKKMLERYCELLSKRCKTTFTSTDLGTEHLVGKEAHLENRALLRPMKKDGCISNLFLIVEWKIL